jgi:hypothetical protein
VYVLVHAHENCSLKIQSRTNQRQNVTDCPACHALFTLGTHSFTIKNFWRLRPFHIRVRQFESGTKKRNLKIPS